MYTKVVSSVFELLKQDMELEATDKLVDYLDKSLFNGNLEEINKCLNYIQTLEGITPRVMGGIFVALLPAKNILSSYPSFKYWALST